MRSTTSNIFSFIASASVVSAAVIPGLSFNPSHVLKRASLAGQATFYGGNVQGGACSFSTYTLPSNIYGTALSSSNWADSAECGACVEVTGPSGNSITAMIVDECPGCGDNHLDLFPDAFSALAPSSEGVIGVTWTYTSCPITTPLELVNKAGVSAYWFSMEVVNANEAVSTLEVSTDSGSTWQSTTRATYNFFENTSGFGVTEVDVKVTSTGGDVVIVNNVQVEGGGSATASANFGGASSAAVAKAVSVASSSVVAVSTVAAASSSSVVADPTIAAQVTSAAVASASSVSSAVPTSPAVASSAATEIAIAATTSEAAPAAPLSTSESSKTTSVIFVTVTAGRPGVTADSCYA